MGQPAVQHYEGKWLPFGRARFVRVVLDQEWQLTVEKDGWVTVAQAALLIGITDQVVADWVRAYLLDVERVRRHDESGAFQLRLDMVRDIYQHRRENGQVSTAWLVELTGETPL